MKKLLTRVLLSRFSALLMVAWLFVFAQTATLLHAEIHPFHEHTAECDIFQGVQHQSTDVPQAVSLPNITITVVLVSESVVYSYFPPVLNGFHARAPPRSFVA